MACKNSAGVPAPAAGQGTYFDHQPALIGSRPQQHWVPTSVYPNRLQLQHQLRYQCAAPFQAAAIHQRFFYAPGDGQLTSSTGMEASTQYMQQSDITGHVENWGPGDAGTGQMLQPLGVSIGYPTRLGNATAKAGALLNHGRAILHESNIDPGLRGACSAPAAPSSAATCSLQRPASTSSRTTSPDTNFTPTSEPSLATLTWPTDIDYTTRPNTYTTASGRTCKRICTLPTPATQRALGHLVSVLGCCRQSACTGREIQSVWIPAVEEHFKRAVERDTTGRLANAELVFDVAKVLNYVGNHGRRVYTALRERDEAYARWVEWVDGERRRRGLLGDGRVTRARVRKQLERERRAKEECAMERKGPLKGEVAGKGCASGKGSVLHPIAVLDEPEKRFYFLVEAPSASVNDPGRKVLMSWSGVPIGQELVVADPPRN